VVETEKGGDFAGGREKKLNLALHVGGKKENSGDKTSRNKKTSKGLWGEPTHGEKKT